MRIDAILPAGGRVRGAVTHTDVKALLPLHGATVLERTVAAVRATGRVRRVVVVGPLEVQRCAAHLVDAVLPEGDSGPQNLLRGLRGLGWLGEGNAERPDRVLICTTDLPFVTAEAISGFLDACPPELDVCVPVIERTEYEVRFARPGTRYVGLRDGAWMIGCAFLVNPAALVRNEALIERVFAARRSQLGMARLLGLPFVLRFLMRRLALPDIEHKCLQLLGCTGGAIRGCAPELGYDIDYPADYQYAKLRWERQE